MIFFMIFNHLQKMPVCPLLLLLLLSRLTVVSHKAKKKQQASVLQDHSAITVIYTRRSSKFFSQDTMKAIA